MARTGFQSDRNSHRPSHQAEMRADQKLPTIAHEPKCSLAVMVIVSDSWQNKRSLTGNMGTERLRAIITIIIRCIKQRQLTDLFAH